MNKKNVIGQVGNFIVGKDAGNGFEYLWIKAVSGVWSVRFRSDNAMFHSLGEILGDEALQEYLEAWIKMCFILTNTTTDLDFMGEFFKSYTDYRERLRVMREGVSDEEDRKILDEERTVAEMKEEAEEE